MCKYLLQSSKVYFAFSKQSVKCIITLANIKDIQKIVHKKLLGLSEAVNFCWNSRAIIFKSSHFIAPSL